MVVVQPDPVATQVATAPEPEFERPVPLYSDLLVILDALKGFSWKRRLLRTRDPNNSFSLTMMATDGAAPPPPLSARSSAASVSITDNQIWDQILTQDDKLITLALQAFCEHFLGASLKRASLSVKAVENLYGAGESTYDLSTTLLRALVDENNPQHLTDAQKELARATVNLTDDVRQHLLSMYVHIMALIKAILVRLYCNTGSEVDAPQFRTGAFNYTNGGAAPNELVVSLQQAVPKELCNLLGDLDSVRIVLLQAEKKGFMNLGDYPHAWTQFISETVGASAHILDSIAVTQDQLLQLRQTIQQRDIELQKIHTMYSIPENQFQLLAAERNRLGLELSNSQSVSHMLGCDDRLSPQTVLQVGASVLPPPAQL